ncbi:MAG: hypothetical protein JNG84_10950 [Archangium sp.]|nr:hypothetical protein [Archangium sp.]
MTRFIALTVVVLSTACATTPPAEPARKLQPLDHQGQPFLPFEGLGATYSIQKRLQVTDHLREPGIAWFDFVDTVNACMGSVVFRSTSQAEDIRRRVAGNVAESTTEYQKDGIQVQVSQRTKASLGEAWSVNVLTLTNPSDTAAKSHLGLFLPTQQLGVLIDIFCRDPGFMDAAIAEAITVVETQKR